MGWLVALLLLLEALAPVVLAFAALFLINRYLADRRLVASAYRHCKKTGSAAPFLTGRRLKMWLQLEEIDLRETARALLWRKLWLRLRHHRRKPIDADFSKHWQEVYRSGRVSVERSTK